MTGKTQLALWARTAAVVTAATTAGVLALGGRARALEGEFTERTRERLAAQVTLEAGDAPLGEIALRVSEQTGLSFVASVFVARLPEPVAVVAKDVPAGDLIEAIAFSMHLDYHITPGGVVSFRMEDDDPRREALLRRVLPPPEERRRAEGPPPRIDEGELTERVADHPKVRALLDKLDAELVPGKFHQEKRVWMLLLRREGEEAPLGHVVAREDGDVIDIKMRRTDVKTRRKKKRPEHKPGEPEGPEEGERF